MSVKDIKQEVLKKQDEKKIEEKELLSQDITPDLISEYLYTKKIPDPDLIIRTSGEYRLSNFLLWQIAYTEIHITSALWPDFREKEYLAALEDFQNRERRFGATGK